MRKGRNEETRIRASIIMGMLENGITIHSKNKLKTLKTCGLSQLKITKICNVPANVGWGWRTRERLSMVALVIGTDTGGG